MEKIYKQYASVMEDLRDLEAKRDALKGDLIELLKDEPEKKKETDFGKFTLSNRLSWRYSQKILDRENKLKIAQEMERKKGIAKATVTEYVMFTTPKE